MRDDAGYLFVIGGQRCGTSLLRDLLDAHPDIEMARPFRPETKWFLDAESANDAQAFVDALFDSRTSPAWRGEKATSYIESPDAAVRIARTFGRARIVAVVRDPIARAVSNYAFSVRHGVEDRPIDVALDPDTPPRDWDPERFSVSPFDYLERGRYAEQLARWHELFPGAVTIIDFEDLVEGRAFSALLTSLGLPPVDCVHPERVNASPGVLEWPSGPLLERLRAYFAEPNAALARMLGRGPNRWPASPSAASGDE